MKRYLPLLFAVLVSLLAGYGAYRLASCVQIAGCEGWADLAGIVGGGVAFCIMAVCMIGGGADAHIRQ